ncbi:MAG TPA: flavin reductase family protein [Rhodocyclaceae bacterium]|nr:flavin reductase family protein [Rhodocyclaceae bacterium]
MTAKPRYFDNEETLALRRTLGGYATGVAVVTARGSDGRLVGLTINSFASVSLYPPLVLWSLGLGSASLKTFEQCSHFAINVLADDQLELSQRFSQPHADKFSDLDWKVGAGETALLPGCCAWLECRTEVRYPGGDHLIFIGCVENFDSEEKPPLIFHGGRYRQLR